MVKNMFLMVAVMFSLNASADDKALGNVKLFERKQLVNLDDCAKNWEIILGECLVRTGNSKSVEIIPAGQEIFKRLKFGTNECSVRFNLNSSPTAGQSYEIRFSPIKGYSANYGKVTFSDARACIEKALSEEEGYITAKFFGAE